jgi:hypothetical protein
MKLSALLFVFSFTMSTAVAYADSLIPTTVLPEQTFVPKGFDSNDNAQIVLYGKFHDVCHQLAPVKFTVDSVNHKITIRNQIYSTAGICPEIFVNTPYTSIVNLGSLKPANYDVYVQNQAGTLTWVNQLPIALPAQTVRTDNFTYAQIEEVNTVKVREINTLPIVLKGTLSNSCLKVIEVNVSLSAGQVYDVLPIMSMEGTHCVEINTPFSISVNLPNFPSTPTLINVRSRRTFCRHFPNRLQIT